MYYLERVCQTLVLAYSTGRPLNVMSDAVAEKTAQEWEEYADQSLAHFEEMKGILAKQSPDFAD
jgi:ribulose-5-phosphate 4-epimerase/fuculose-1-phosphate aldolase